MSQKKHKKRHSQSSDAAKRRAREDEIADRKDRDRKRMDPTARALLLGDLVYLAVCELLTRNGIISDFVSGCLTIVAVVVMLLALWFQFLRPKPGQRPKNGSIRRP